MFTGRVSVQAEDIPFTQAQAIARTILYDA